MVRMRRLGSLFGSSMKVKEDKDEEGEEKQKEVNEGFEDDGEWFCTLISLLRLVACFLTFLITGMVWAVIMTLLLPWPWERIKQGNMCGQLNGWLLMKILGNPIKIEGIENTKNRAIYISNHASPIDILLMMWLCPVGTVGIAKKEIIFYPIYGQIYTLAHHIRIDRSNPTAAIESLKKAAQAIVKNNLSLVLFPEGTRSRNGRLLPFKKGFVHMAIQTGLPIVPILLIGTHLAWQKGSLRLRPTPITVKYLPPIKTDGWTVDNIDEYINLVHDVYVKNLPESQRPLVLVEKSH